MEWYDTDILNEKIKDTKFDMVIVDGSLAYLKEKERSRFPALHYVKNKLACNYSLFLHDTDRYGEQSIIKDWESSVKIPSTRFTSKLSGFIEGQKFTISV